jgi:hypothetical protein
VRGVRSVPFSAGIPTGVTITRLRHFQAEAVATTGGTLTTHIGYDCAVNTGGTIISYRSTGANAQMRHAGDAAFGINAAPNVGLDSAQDFAMRVESRTLVNGGNDNVDADDISHLRITGPTAAFTTTGFTDGQDGKVLVVMNGTTQQWTIVNDAMSTAANRIYTGDGADVVLAAAGGTTDLSIAVFVYSSTDSRWRMICARDTAGPQ